MIRQVWLYIENVKLITNGHFSSCHAWFISWRCGPLYIYNDKSGYSVNHYCKSWLLRASQYLAHAFLLSANYDVFRIYLLGTRRL